MNELEAASTDSFASQAKEKVDLNILLRNPNFDAEHCESSILFKIDQTQLDSELERLKKKIQRYEISLKDRPLEFVGYTYLRKTQTENEEKQAEKELTTGSRVKNFDKSSSNLKPESEKQGEEGPINEYDLNILKRVINFS
jgi:hypothetical protein